MKIKYLLSQDGLSLWFSNGTNMSVQREHRNYNCMVNMLLEVDIQNPPDETEFENKLKKLADLDTFISEASDGQIRLKGSEPQIKTEDETWERLEPELYDRFSQFIENEIPLTPFLRFHRKLNNNPSWNSRGQLFNFIDNREMPVLASGEVLGYKGVAEDFMDIHSGTVSNKVGSTIEMDRRGVDDNPNNSCSYGYHVGSHSYASSWKGQDGRLLLVAFSPEDAVSVPHDSCDKLRVCKYRVIADITDNPHPLTEPAFTASGEGVTKIKKFKEETESYNYHDFDFADAKERTIKNYLAKRIGKIKDNKLIKKTKKKFGVSSTTIANYWRDLCLR